MCVCVCVCVRVRAFFFFFAEGKLLDHYDHVINWKQVERERERELTTPEVQERCE